MCDENDKIPVYAVVLSSKQKIKIKTIWSQRIINEQLRAWEWNLIIIKCIKLDVGE